MHIQLTVDGKRVTRKRQALAGGLLALLFVERVRGLNALRITFALVNGFPGTGAALFHEIELRVGGEVLFELRGNHAVQVRGILARRVYAGPDAAKLEGYHHIRLAQGYPAWVEEVCLEGLQEARDGAELIGPYRIGDPGVKGPSSLDGSHGGWKVGPWHMGPRGWQRASRNGYRWAEVDMFDTLDRSPLAVFCPDTLRPFMPGTAYWPGRSNVSLPGYLPDTDTACPYLPELEEWEAHAYSHLHRETCAAAMLAPRDSFARWVLTEVYWHDIKLWLGGAESLVPLLQPARQVIRDLPAHQGWANAGRGLAHSVRCFLYARPYLPRAERRYWTRLLRALLLHVARPNGILHSRPFDPNAPQISPSARAREVDLMFPNFAGLGGWRMWMLARRCRKTMARRRGVSVASSFEAGARHWSLGETWLPGYYPDYDLIRGHRAPDPVPRWLSPGEQMLSLIPQP